MVMSVGLVGEKYEWEKDQVIKKKMNFTGAFVYNLRILLKS